MKNRILILSVRLFAAWILAISAAYAEIPIQNESEISGSWLMESASTKPDGPRVARGETWNIEAGKLEKTGLIMARSGTYDVPPVDYKIEDGKLLVAIVGRPGKFNAFTLIDRTPQTMTLFAQSEGYLHFKRK